MKRIFILVLLFTGNAVLFSQDLKYFLPDSVTYKAGIPKPDDIVYHQVGEWHITHDRLVNYMKAIAGAAPDRVKLETMGYTYEGRPQLLLIFTSAKNLQNLEQIRQQHLMLSDPSRSGSLDIEKMPIVVYIGHSIHGNEPSGSNAALLSAYYLAAAQGKQIDELLDNTVILFDPSFNPDGLQRFSTWANQHKSKNLVSDPNSREFNEIWPGGRFNHYWFDLNRDWLPAVNVESQNRLKWYHLWKPNILTDHHEMSSNATFFFQPGVPSRVNPITPDKNQELTAKLGEFHAAFLDRIGSMYFSREGFDDFYYGKGSTYPDVNGAIGVLFEQGSSRGHAQQTANGLLTFSFTIKNQFVTTLSTLEGAKALKNEFLQWQRDFYKTAITEAGAAAVKGYVFGDSKSGVVSNELIAMLNRHQVDVYKIKSYVKAGGIEFDSRFSYIVPANQPQYRLIRTIFEKTFNYKDSLFYDITSWTFPLAFGLPYAELDAVLYNQNLLGEKQLSTGIKKETGNTGKSEIGYLIRWDDFNSPKFLNELLNAGVLVKVATREFTTLPVSTPKFSPGTLLVTVKNQDRTSADLYALLQELSKGIGIETFPVSSGLSLSGVDLGSNKFVPLAKPNIAMITGVGVFATDAGEVWHLLDQRMNIRSSHLESAVFNRVDLGKYNTIIMVGGTYPDLDKGKLKSWVQGGGTLILTEEAVSWASQNGITDVKLKSVKSAVDSVNRLSYMQREQIEGAQQMNGAIFGAEADLTHPLAFGYNMKTISLFKSNKVFMEKSMNPYGSPYYYKEKSLQSGWVSRENLDAVKNSAAVNVSVSGNGRVISIADNPNFRGLWLGGTRLFMNALFFGRIIDAATARTDE